MSTIFERSEAGRENRAQQVAATSYAADSEIFAADIPLNLRRKSKAKLPEVSELQTVRHYTELSQKNFSIDTNFYPLGSCTMKYNPRASNTLAMQSGFINRHPASDVALGQGVLVSLYDFQEILCEVTGMEAASLSPAAGAQGEFAGVAMIRAYHDDRGDSDRSEILVPDAAHGTNPASAVMCGYKVREIPTDLKTGDIDIAALREVVGPATAGIMLTNPSTLGVFERQIEEIASIMHKAGGLLYYDGANLNAILGKTRPGDMGFDVIHINVHKTFSTPHGGGGPGSGPVVANKRLSPYLPIPMVGKFGSEYRWLDEDDCPRTIGRLSAWSGNVGVLLRGYIYARMLGSKGMERVAEYSVLNANYLMKRLQEAGFTLALPDRRATHEFIVTLKNEAKSFNISTMDFAKRLLDYGHHAPTTYFPLLVPECLLIEPTETEDKETLDLFVDAMAAILSEAEHTPEMLKDAPWTLPVRRLDDVRAARELNLNWYKS
ncbi:MAG: aminomethyl-transferring glycine dehydrogenase subunit GcvPB [Thiotrichales bacterium]|jgi:glycine dehydrogenase subunit 2|nr:aminomethyl-transferring glycine dehydrogenase subunit GcvPB [Thiotrichales bacterium]MBT3614230.1 aminomethyl-transferring glycine dehydrogenase subunit GcvPB [Thiotrichales bacterium]MBT3752048.1 aminomethyl-transferring glycine dehydrogenase subunit GcvPB [Thiotrichales bacterium]MBT3837431.1 aminomethyl-transferring glycine dehydrogenase subunit GcvPB [Thiotrichales bacterium]MBT4152716.1 aminomethyl-transferring glycine dehydrogenase subunit GcvPB [Thiotrichales bacterium]